MTEKEMRILWGRFGESGDYMGTCERFAKSYDYSLDFVMGVLDEMINERYDEAIGSWR